ncbi:MAG: CCA tRNA nucleotidyltransferase [Clostridia bacterium]|nr:CCA tRNA nucleotidyltransferase [Clostridia bacterium]
MIIKIPPQVNTALEILSAKGFDAYVVGGAVRDAIMGLEPDDFDITTSALPQETAKAFEGCRIIETGIKHGTVTVIVDDMPIEITTYRIDKDYKDNRHPESVEFTDNINLDLARRDFTVNAIAYNPKAGFVDPYGGLDDIKDEIIRCVGDPDTRFNEDGLRILRALRFAAQKQFKIDETTAISIHKNRQLLDNISKERIYAELIKMLPGVTKDFLLEYSDVIFQIIPELKKEKGCKQNNPYHIYDVWEHTSVTVENATPDPEIRLAMLLHDIGKPVCKTTDENGTDHFYGHEKVSAEIAEQVLINLKVSNATRQRVKTLVELHGFIPHIISKKTYRKYIGTYGADLVKDLFDVRYADICGQNPVYLQERIEQNKQGLDIVNELTEKENCFTINNLAVGGKDLIREGIEASPRMGQILSTLFDEVISDKLKNEKSALINRAKELNINGNSKNS